MSRENLKKNSDSGPFNCSNFNCPHPKKGELVLNKWACHMIVTAQLTCKMNSLCYQPTQYPPFSVSISP